MHARGDCLPAGRAGRTAWSAQDLSGLRGQDAAGRVRWGDGKGGQELLTEPIPGRRQCHPRVPLSLPGTGWKSACCLRAGSGDRPWSWQRPPQSHKAEAGDGGGEEPSSVALSS